MSVGHNYASNGPSSILASVTTTGYARRITILDSSYKSGTYPIDDLRLMSLSGNELALDIHYAINEENSINSSFILGLSEPSQIVPQTPTSVQDAPPGETLEALADWLNPPMQLGVEYRTAERYNGKPVYMMALNFTGSLANSDGVQVMISDMPKSATKVIWSNVIIENTASGERAQLPSVDETGKVTAYFYARAEDGYDGLILGIMSTMDMSGWTAPVFIVKYVKTTD